MFFIFALLSASSFRSPNAAVTVTLTPKGADEVTLTCTVAESLGTDVTLAVVFTPPTAADAVAIDANFAGTATTSTAVDIPIVAAKADRSLVAGTKYTITITNHEPTPAEYTPAFNYPALTVTLTATTKTKYSLKCAVATAVTEEDGLAIPIKFTAGDKSISPTVKIAKGATAQTVDLTIVTTAAEGKFLAGTAYTITCEGYTPSETTFTPADNSKLTGESALAKEGEKEDGAKDKVTEADLPENYTQKLTLKDTAAPATANDERILDKSETFKWTHAAGSVAVEYLFKDCPIMKGSTVNATLVISPDLTFTDQPITYAAGAKSVASVVAALIAIISFVF
ncbi:hypothetical protein BLNAU_9964 [Blattamonas nauphoetae]|uniref:Uncharacterized protein n=1 Tax=Blattamonas nauphoetae TaxID=2049346 RepID=A0ABQ9XU71_9EUKA|nr:hypothetical protein BLNAU_9964 [Blattamonas nauphoetae]